MNYWRQITGWKTVIGYFSAFLLELVHDGNPMVLNALKRLVVAPNLMTFLESLAQLLLLIGVVDKARRNLNVGGTMYVDRNTDRKP